MFEHLSSLFEQKLLAMKLETFIDLKKLLKIRFQQTVVRHNDYEKEWLRDKMSTRSVDYAA